MSTPQFALGPAATSASSKGKQPKDDRQIGNFFITFDTSAYLARYSATLNRGAFEPILPGVPGYERLLFGLDLARYGVFNIKRVWDTMVLAEAKKKGFQPQAGEGLDKALARVRAELPGFRVPAPGLAEWRAALELMPDQGQVGVRLGSFIAIMGGVAAVNRASGGMKVDVQAIQGLRQTLAELVKFTQTPEVAARAASVLQSLQARKLQASTDLDALFGDPAAEMEAAA